MPTTTVFKTGFRTYYVVFEKSSYRRPWHVFTGDKYQHVWLFFGKYNGPEGLLTEQSTIKIEPLSTFIDVDVWSASPEEVASAFIKMPSVQDIVTITLPYGHDLGYRLRGMINCVSLMKAIMGLSCFFVLTPKQLYRYLRRNGGRSF